jgi:CubicO group peptidase (beta-lactamase class C family)
MDERDLGALLAEHVDRHRVPGAAVGVLTPETRLVAAHGVADVATGERVGPDTVFAAGSLTKSMVATAVALLCAAGRMDLDDPVARHVPELRTAPWAATSTLRDLMANRSRVPLRADLEFGFAARAGADDGALARLAAEAAEHPASVSGAWSYSNLGWCLLGRAVEVVAGSPWESAMEAVLAPAGLMSTSFGPEPAGPRRATGHTVTGGQPVPVPPASSRAYGPAGLGTTTSVDDLLRFAQLHLTAPEVAPLRRVHAPVSISGWLDAWCLGWARFSWEGGAAWGWDGVVDGQRSVLRLLPADRVAVAVLTNGSNGRALHRTLLAELVPQVSGLRPSSVLLTPRPGAAGTLARFAGTYAWPDQRTTVAVRSDVLCLTTDEGEAQARPIDGRTFLVDLADPDTPTVTFGGFDRDGVPSVLYDMVWGLPRVTARDETQN